MYDFATRFWSAITRNFRRTSNSVSGSGRSSFSSKRIASGTVASIRESRESYPICCSISLNSSSLGPTCRSTNDGKRMFVFFLETFLLSIAKHGVEGRELQVAGIQLSRDQDSLDPLVTVAHSRFLHIVKRWSVTRRIRP